MSSDLIPDDYAKKVTLYFYYDYYNTFSIKYFLFPEIFLEVGKNCFFFLFPLNIIPEHSSFFYLFNFIRHFCYHAST